jgi:hypothetical protein
MLYRKEKAWTSLSDIQERPSPIHPNKVNVHADVNIQLIFRDECFEIGRFGHPHIN